jgi:hypothetical protein
MMSMGQVFSNILSKTGVHVTPEKILLGEKYIFGLTLDELINLFG